MRKTILLCALTLATAPAYGAPLSRSECQTLLSSFNKAKIARTTFVELTLAGHNVFHCGNSYPDQNTESFVILEMIHDAQLLRLADYLGPQGFEEFERADEREIKSKQ